MDTEPLGIGVSVSDECPSGVQCHVDTEPLGIGVSVSDECPSGVQYPVDTEPLIRDRCLR